MSQVPSASASASLSNFQPIFNAALKAYEKKTKKDLLAHPLAAQLQACISPSDTLSVLQDVVKQFDQLRSTDERLSKWLNPTINVLYSFSAALGAGVGLVFSPAAVIFSGIGVLLQAAKDVEASQDALIDLFERIENFFKRLESYTAVPPTDAMTDIIVKIMIEVLNIFAIATKEILRARYKQFLRKLIGLKEMEDALKRLDKLTQDEARMAAAETLRLTYMVHDNVTTVVNDGKETKQVVQQIASGVDAIKWDQVRGNLRRWVTPPDPSTNHNIACGIQHDGTAQWFFRGGIFTKWKSSIGSLLWVHGKPGSGKSILCSAIIQNIETLRKAGLAFMAYFYFDFRDRDKQNCRNLLLSLLAQLSTQSNLCCDVLYRLYVEHDEGSHAPSDAAMAQCFNDMLTNPKQPPIYIILDALDECPDSYGIPTPREQVLTFIKELMDLRLPNLHICVTSRPEFDIRATLGRLALRSVSLHTENGQKKDIVDYVNSVVFSESETMMKKWRNDDKKMVVKSLSERADGMFRWVFCQLEALRHCLPPSVLRTLNELPKSLDDTYERMMVEIMSANQSHACRMLQCLAVTNRPLSVAELAELLAFDFDDAKGGIPKLNPDWRWEDHEQAVLATCSSLVTVIPNDGSPVVQFSHFSVKKFLMSDRLATSKRDISQYHITPEHAHMLLTQASLAVLLRDRDNTSADTAPLARYAAEHWITHAQVKNVASRVRVAMQDLFDPEKPYFEAWVRSHDIDRFFRVHSSIAPNSEPGARPLYYAAWGGFHELVEHLTDKYPHCAKARGGKCGTALHSASFEGRLQVVRHLLRHGVDVNVRNSANCTSLLLAAWEGHCDVVRYLLEHGADVDLRDKFSNTPLILSAYNGHVGAVRLLLEHNADANSQNDDGRSPLHNAIRCTRFEADRLQMVRLLLEHGADVNLRNNNKRRTPLHLVSKRADLIDVLRLLLEHGADLDAEDKDGKTPLQLSLERGCYEITRFLSKYSTTMPVSR